MVGRNSTRVPESVKNRFADPDEFHETRSCLALPRRFSSKRSVSSSQSSNSRRGKSKHVDAQLLRESDPFVQPNSWESAVHNVRRRSQHQQQQQQQYPVDSGAAGPQHRRPSPTSHLESLLVPPAPTDRNPRRMALQQLQQQQQYEEQRHQQEEFHKARQRGLYEGELQPGVRGQQAVVRPMSASSPRTALPSVPSSSSSASSSNNKRLNIVSPDNSVGGGVFDYSQSTASRSGDSTGQSQRTRASAQRGLETVEERAPLQFSPETGRAERWRGNPQTGTRSFAPVTPIMSRMYSDAESTCSDEDIRRMLPDLLPSLSEQEPGKSSPAVITPNPIGPSRVAQKAAAAAAGATDALSAGTSVQSETQRMALHEKEDIEWLNTTALNHVHTGEYDKALTSFSKVLDLNRTRHGESHPTVASAFHNLGTVHAKKSSMFSEDSVAQRQSRSAALEAFQAAARTARDSLGRNHPNVAVSLVRIGFLLLQSRQYRNAVVTFTEALRIRLAHFGPTHGLVANLYNNLGVCYMHVQDFVMGKQQLDKALRVQRALVANDTNSSENEDDKWVHLLELADTLFNVGGLCLEWIRRQGPDSRRTVEAVEAFTECLDIRKRVLGEEDPSVVQVRSLLSMAQSFPSPRGSRPGTPTERPSTPRSSGSRRPTTPTSENKGSNGIFRSSNTQSSSDSRVPLPVVSVSRDEEDDRLPGSQKIVVESFSVPETSPPRTNRDVSNEAIKGTSYEDPMSVDTSSETMRTNRGGPLASAYHYDAEESCILNNTGVDSEHGRVHYPLTWQKAGLTSDTEQSAEGPDIVVARPVLRKADKSGKFATTGNKDRDDVMSRARAILSAHADTEDADVSTTEGMSIETTEFSGADRHGNGKDKNFDQDILEDGIAPLGGSWPSRPGAGMPIRTMLLDPMNHLPSLHEEGSMLLKNNYAVDAVHLFDVVLQCQNRRNGPLHPDVAAALHNVGIAQLRAHNHEEALKAFEEAARVRKGSLGRDHPHVAISLVKVGITLLLLRRFDDALWSFREALSVRKSALGPLHPSTARIYNNIGCVHVEFNEFKEARRAFEAALDVQRNALVADPDNGPLMFGTATTLCNLGYLYRYRDMHVKASLVLKEAVELQETVLGHSHPTVLSTLDNLADSYSNGGHVAEALRTYNLILDRFRGDGGANQTKMSRAEAVLLYKMSRVHRQRKDRGAQLDSLKLALQAIRSYTETSLGDKPDSLERRIQYDIRACREQLEKDERNWL